MRELIDLAHEQRYHICDVRGKTSQDYRRVQGFNMSTKIDENKNLIFQNIYKIISVSL